MDAVGVDAGEMGHKVSEAVIGFFILYFIISPIMGRIMARGIERAWAFSVITCSMLATFSLLYVALNYFLRQAIPVETLDDMRVLIISMTLASGSSILMGGYLRWHFSTTNVSFLQKQMDDLEDELPFERNRREFLERRAKAQKR